MIERAVKQRPGLFCKKSPYMQKIWDSTSYGLMSDCPRKYYFTIILGFVQDPPPPPLWFGIYLHMGIETYIKAKASGKKEPLLIAIKKILKETYGYEPLRDTARTRYTLIRALVWYADHYKDAQAEVITLGKGKSKKPAAELSFKFPLSLTSPDGDPYIASGHWDAVVRFAGDIWVNECKSTKFALDEDYFKRYTPDNQVSWYTFASGLALTEPAKGVIIDAVQTGVNFTRFRRALVPRTKESIQEWLRDVLIQIKIAEKYAEARYWPGNLSSCSKWGGCTFREVCGKSPSVRRNFLKAKFVVRPWNPLDNR